jgi:hypothetical protein
MVRKARDCAFTFSKVVGLKDEGAQRCTKDVGRRKTPGHQR